MYKRIFAGLLSTISLAVYASNMDEQYVVAPHCLTKNLTEAHQTLAQKNAYSLIQTNEAGLNQLITAKDHQKQLCGGFFNVTDAYKAEKNANALLARYSEAQPTKKSLTDHYTIQYKREVAQLLSLLNPQNMWTNLTTLTHFTDRDANSDTGIQAANWIKTQVEKMAKDNGRNDVTVFTVDTVSYKQPSVVVKIGNSSEPGIVIGAHMDTLGHFFGNMPGADDDGTGTVTVLETARTLLSSNMHFKKPIYLIWYSAEEQGLVGSQHVVAEFKKKNIAVENVMHFDMTGFAYKNEKTMWLLNDYTNKDLTSYLADLITTYVNEPIQYTACGYACSDHATWNNNGYKAAIAIESSFSNYNPNIHSANDKMDKLSLTHMTDYAKLAIAFAVELAEPA